MDYKQASKQRMNIALCVGMLESDFSYAVCEGALIAAKDLDVNLFVFPGGILELGNRPTEERNMRYHYQYNVLFSYPNVESFDAVIVEYGVITSLLEPEQKKEFLEGFGDVPILLLAGSEEGYSSITIDNQSGIKQAIRHLAEEHNCRKIGFVSGPRTNQDAIERLQAFRESVKELGLEDAESLIGYGDFTGYYPEITEELIRKNSGIEAIVYANDQMAVSGYQAVRNMNLEPGKDILIVGFDDSPLAMTVEPYMTSVRVDIKEMAYRAVMACQDLVVGKEVSLLVPSRLVSRESCGCNNANIAKQFSVEMFSRQKEDAISYLLDELMEKYVNSIYDPDEKLRVREKMSKYFHFYFGLLKKDGFLRMDSGELEQEYSEFMSLCLRGYFDLDVFFLINQILYCYLSVQVVDDKSCRWLLEETIFRSRTAVNNDNIKKRITDERNKIFEALLTNITGDILQQHPYANETHRFESVIDKLQRLECSSSYLYFYEDRIPYMGREHWENPKKCYIRARHDGKKSNVYDEFEKAVECQKIFSQENMSSERRYSMLVLPLFSNDVQYGVTMMEGELENFRFAQQIACQISVTIEVLHIIKEQNGIKRELEQNLAKSVETNKLLDEMSRKDPMTGVMNRRGFFDMANEMLHKEENYGKKAIALYADMDCLKVINDEFGHDDGDFSLKTIANVLYDSFRKQDVVGRMGGDEFAVLTMIDQDDYGILLKERIQGSLTEVNNNCDKPYYIGMSIGFYEFVISDDTNIEEVLRKADEKLYQEKKGKVKRVYK